MKNKRCTKCSKNKRATKKNFYRSIDKRNGKLYTRPDCVDCGRDANKTQKKQYRHDAKLLVLNQYGCKCNWPGCEIIEPIFLTGDHIHNDGALHRKEIGIGGDRLHRWLIKNNFPPGFQILCWNHQHLKQLEFYKSNWELNKKAAIKRKSLLKLRLEVISHYGGYCACCGESNIDLLCIDHICGEGTKHVKSIGGSDYLYRWLKNNNFPPGYQVLCWNCNCGRSVNGGICPHKKRKNEKR